MIKRYTYDWIVRNEGFFKGEKLLLESEVIELLKEVRGIMETVQGCEYDGEGACPHCKKLVTPFLTKLDQTIGGE